MAWTWIQQQNRLEVVMTTVYDTMSPIKDIMS